MEGISAPRHNITQEHIFVYGKNYGFFIHSLRSRGCFLDGKVRHTPIHVRTSYRHTHTFPFVHFPSSSSSIYNTKRAHFKGKKVSRHFFTVNYLFTQKSLNVPH